LPVPRELDLLVARRKLKSWGTEIDSLTPEQAAYLGENVAE
jgi:S-adenosylhomocysteine hydrolase